MTATIDNHEHEEEKYVKCIDNQFGAFPLTLDKLYKVLKETSDYYCINDDNGERTFYKKERFKELKPKKRIKCIDNLRGGLKHLTVGEEYEVHKETTGFYYIRDDEGNVRFYLKERFTSVDNKGISMNSPCVGEAFAQLTKDVNKAKRKRVVYKDNDGYGNKGGCLTIGNAYEVTSETNDMYLIIDDDGDTVNVFKWRFEVLAEGFASREVTITLENKEDDKVTKKQVKCIDSTSKRRLTVGKVYDVIEEGGNEYLIINDIGVRCYYSKGRFEEVAEVQGDAGMINDATGGITFAVNEPSRTYFYATKYGIKEITLKNVTEVTIQKSGTHRLKADGKLEIIPAGWLRVSIEGAEWSF